MTTIATMKTPVEVDATLRPALVDLLYRLGDDSLIIGHRNSEWTGIGPILEEDIAFSSMSQDKMGHAVAFYTLLHELGEPDPDRIAYARGSSEYRCCSLVVLECLTAMRADEEPPLCNNPVRDTLLHRGDWAASLVRQFFFSEADAVRMTSLEQSAYVPLAQLARKLRGELKYHTLHGRTMIERLGRATPDSRARLQASIDQLYPHALGMFESTKYDAALAEAAICPTEGELCERWQREMEPTLRKAGLQLPSGAKPIVGGRIGKHPAELTSLLDDLQRVYRLDPNAQW